MEHVYSVLIPNLIESLNLSSNSGLLEWILDKKCLCRVSNLNLLAFTASTEITSNEFEYSYNNIYVIDLNLPNEPHLIKNHQSRITSLEWNNTGQKLILGDVDGNIEVWCRKDYLINQWQLNYKETCFEGETVLSIIWFNNSLNYKINLNKHDQQHIPYNEKFNLSKFESTVKQFGKKSADGFICISNSGIIWSICFSSDGQILKAKEILGDMQNRIQLIDVNYRLNGDLIIATSNGLVDYPINLYSITINSEQTDCLEINKLIIKCDNFNSFFAKSNNQLNNEINKNHKFITHLKFVKKEESNSLLVGCASSMGSSLELWNLQDRPCQINKRFLNNDTSTMVQKTVKQWIFITGCNYSHRIVSLSVMNSSIYNTDQNLQPFIVVAYKDNVIKCLIKENLQVASSLNLNSAYKTQLNENTKLISNLLNVEDMQFTWSGSGLIILDNASQIFLYKMPAIIDYRSELYKPTFVVMLLEYSMLNSFDWWDILLTIKPNLIESICDRFTENFKSQHSSIQQKYQHKYLAIKGSIYRISNVISIGLNKSGDCYALALLYSITNLIRMVLRTSANKNLDKEGPIEYITKVVQNNVNELQLTKILIILDNVNKDCFVETSVSQSLQHLIQWIGDLTLYLVGSYPQQQNIRFPGGGLIYDKLAINTLRELLVIIQIWAVPNENCLPVFTKLNDNNDVMSSLYKLLTKSLSFTNTEPDEQFLEECCSLSNDVLITQLDLTLKARGIISPPLYFSDWPLALNYGKEASFLSYPGYKIPTVDGAIDCSLNGKIDVIRRIGLGNLAGIKNTNIRKCTRCESISLLEPVLKTQATIAWDSTWKKQCICGGHWSIR